MKHSTILKSVLSLMLAAIMFVGAIPFASISVSAASNWPSLSTTAYCEFKATKTIYCYRNSSCTTRGTISPLRSYNAYISKGDMCKITAISSTWVRLAYPTSSGYRTAYVKRSDLFGVSAPTERVTSKGTAIVYSNTSGTRYGSTAKGDTVFACGTSGSHTLIIYSAKSGYRAYKLGWVKTSDYNSIIKSASVSNTSSATAASSAVKARLDAIGNGTMRYNSSTVMKIGSKYTGTRSNEQCKGYAKNVFYMCFGIIPGSTQLRSKGLNYLINNTTGMTKLGSVTNMTVSRISTLFSNARPGDFVQMRRSHTGSHSAIVYSVSSTGVTFLEANLDGNNTVYLRSYTWPELCSKNAAMSVYTATNYKLK